MESIILEINLISAQGLKLPSSQIGSKQTYAVVWVDSTTKLRTRVDRTGAENPAWYDKFFFRVSPEFLSSETSAVSVEIYSVNYLRDRVIGTVRFLISNLPHPLKTPAFTALQIRRSSGRFYGALNISAMVADTCDFLPVDGGIKAIAYRDYMRKSNVGGLSLHGRKKLGNSMNVEYDSCTADSSDGAESTTSSSSTTSTAMKDFNGMRDLTGMNRTKSVTECGVLLCGLLGQNKAGLKNFVRRSLDDEN